MSINGSLVFGRKLSVVSVSMVRVTYIPNVTRLFLHPRVNFRSNVKDGKIIQAPFFSEISTCFSFTHLKQVGWIAYTKKVIFTPSWFCLVSVCVTTSFI